MGPMKIASVHKQMYKIFKKGVGHELLLNQNLGHAAKKFGNHCSKQSIKIKIAYMSSFVVTAQSGFSVSSSSLWELLLH